MYVHACLFYACKNKHACIFNAYACIFIYFRLLLVLYEHAEINTQPCLI